VRPHRRAEDFARRRGWRDRVYATTNKSRIRGTTLHNCQLVASDHLPIVADIRIG